jgi:hypothetical protein
VETCRTTEYAYDTSSVNKEEICTCMNIFIIHFVVIQGTLFIYLFVYLFLFFSEKSYVNTGLLYNTHSWLPMHIRIELLQNGEVKIKKILPADMESPDEVSIKEDYYKF